MARRGDRLSQEKFPKISDPCVKRPIAPTFPETDMIRKQKWLPAWLRNLLNDVLFLSRERKLWSGPHEHRSFPAANVIWGSPLPDISDTPAPAIVFAAGDACYIQRYAPLLAESLALQNTRLPLHFHQMSAEQEGLAVLEELNRRWPFISWSHDTFDVNGSDRHIRLCQCMRFDALRILMRKTGSSVLLLDIDSVFNADPSPWLTRFHQQGDLGILRRGNQITLAKRYMAGCMWFRHTPAVMSFLDKYTLRMRKHLRLPDIDFLDQRSLWLTLLEKRADVGVFYLARQFVSWNVRENSIIFTAKGKKERNRYLNSGASDAEAQPAARNTAA